MGMAQVKAEGYQLGAAPYGTQHMDKESLGDDALDNNGRVKLSEKPEEVEVISRIMVLRHGGMTYQGIADDLNSEGVTTQKGKTWHKSVIYNIVKRSAR